jgi:hypothetical protein
VGDETDVDTLSSREVAHDVFGALDTIISKDYSTLGGGHTKQYPAAPILSNPFSFRYLIDASMMGSTAGGVCGFSPVLPFCTQAIKSQPSKRFNGIGSPLNMSGMIV